MKYITIINMNKLFRDLIIITAFLLSACGGSAIKPPKKEGCLGRPAGTTCGEKGRENKEKRTSFLVHKTSDIGIDYNAR